MARLTPEQFAEKWGRRLSAASADITAGVERVTESPCKKAAAAIPKLRQNLLKAIDSGKMARRLNAVTVEEWKEKMLSKGVGRIPAGVEAASGKMADFGRQLLPHIDAGKAAIARLPDVTLEDSIGKMVAWTRHMAKFEKK